MPLFGCHTLADSHGSPRKWSRPAEVGAKRRRINFTPGHLCFKRSRVGEFLYALLSGRLQQVADKTINERAQANLLQSQIANSKQIQVRFA